jgi:hypothetical protein
MITYQQEINISNILFFNFHKGRPLPLFFFFFFFFFLVFLYVQVTALGE